ncbi:DNA gyrase subunit A [Candidatus Mycoplasma mahonii]|uniref:DNA gyrase subunit A n=1 Tax=Candidatus Mycoplasma mahonii TaxID=3004105 RepID=UPI0026EE1ECC|nr:DNA gyrase subunit A [Candidatus Mycoplasma mahonii]WKX02433.1 DNA gyrase subunit A [Candidatus Mycoplasma mahonii]
MFDDNEKDPDKLVYDNASDDNDKYLVEEEKMERVFVKEKTQDEKDKEEEIKEAPQNADTYQVKSQIIDDATKGLSPISVSKEMRSSFLEYAMSVIVARALPDARDGLKPVHRRILFGMHELGLTSSVSHKKSARIVGDVLGKYHPHGDSSVYEAMVRMAQDFSMRYPMVDGHGNFGSIDGDGAAAMRYTEARMSKIASLMVQGIRKNTVNFIPNYDGSEVEPEVLPSRIPNLLVTGGTGIAVGMATNIPPHNLTEVINGAIALSRNPEITIEELMEYVTGPDFPTGGIILGSNGIKAAYMTGKGSVKTRSRTRIEELKNGKSKIIVTEIPYMVNKANMIEKIAYLVKDKVIEGITDLRDETSRKGIRIVIELRRDVVPEVLLNKLFKKTQLQTNFSVNSLSLVSGQPQLLNLKQSLEVYLKHQFEIVQRRSEFDLQKIEARSHIIEGLKIAIENIDAVIKTIRSASNDLEAQEKLMNTYSLSQVQSKAITDMRLGRLTGLAIEKMNLEHEELNKTITELQYILNNREVMRDLIIDELEEIKEKFGDTRKTEIVEGIGSIQDEDLIPQKDIAITMSSNGYVKRIPLEEYSSQNRGGIGSRSMTTYEDDNVEKILTTTTHTDLLIFTSYGKVYRIRAHKVPEMSKQSKGIPFLNLIGIEKGEKVISLLTTDSYDDGSFLVTITKKGIIKKTHILEYERINKNGKRALGLKEEDMLVKAMIVTNDEQVIIGSSTGKVVRFDVTEARPMGRTASGVKGINLSDNLKSKVVGASHSLAGDYILSVGEDGFGKKTHFSNYRQTKRGAKGVKSIDTKKAGYLKFVEVVKGNEDILIITKQGITIRTTLTQVANSGRGAKGVKMIKLSDGNAIKSISVIDTFDIEEKVEEAIRKTQEISLKSLK